MLCGESEPWHRKQGAGLGRAQERRRSVRNLSNVIDAMWKTGESWLERVKERRQDGVGSVCADRGYLENKKEAQREAQDVEGMNKKCRGSTSPL